MEENLAPKIGTFFLIIGFSLIIFFVMSDLGQEIEYIYLIIGLPSIALGFFFRRNIEPPPPSGRFERIKKMRNKEKGKE